MKIFVIPAILVIVLSTAWMVYWQWNTQRFIERLSEVRPHTQSEKIPYERTAENENTDTFPSEPVSENINSAAEGHVPSELAAPLDPSNTTHKGEVSQQTELGSRINVKVRQETDERINMKEGARYNPTHIQDLSVEQILENNRLRLREIHGDIPEIDIYLRHARPIFEGAKEGKSELKMRLSQKDALEYSRALSVLFPTEENLKHYKNVLKTEQDLEKRRKQIR
ncbi:MAG: hypothetical protein OXI24_17950 [Candidatus Poribacteria bacterium]|nr:hypothetical protein [Candidatus Poribacteria bacterium]